MFSDGKELSREALIQASKTNLNVLRGATNVSSDIAHDCLIRSHFEDLESHLISYIDSSEYIVGCVAWLTSQTVLSQLARKKVSLIIDASCYPNKSYDSLTSFSSYPPIASIGSTAEQKGEIVPLMHHKFLVFIDKNLRPYSVWTGSFNMTNNASRSLENATLICGDGIAQEYYDEWARLIKVASPI